MQNILIVVDMQNDFIDGALGTAEAQKIVPNVAQKIRDFSGKIIFTRDTHEENYMETQEGKIFRFLTASVEQKDGKYLPYCRITAKSSRSTSLPLVRQSLRHYLRQKMKKKQWNP